MSIESRTSIVTPDNPAAISPRDFVLSCLQEANPSVWMEKLTKRQQDVLKYRFFDLLSPTQIKSIIGVKSRQAVSYHEQRAIDIIANHLPEEKVEAFYANYFRVVGTKPEEAKRNLSQINRGKKRSAQTKERISTSMRARKISEGQLMEMRRVRELSRQQRIAQLAGSIAQ